MVLVDCLSELVSDFIAIKKYMKIEQEDVVLELVPMSRVRMTQEVRLVDITGNILTSVQVPRLCTMEEIDKVIDEYNISDLKNIPRIITDKEQLTS